MKELLKDLETIGEHYDEDLRCAIGGFLIKENYLGEYQRLHTFLTKLSEVDLKEYEHDLQVYERNLKCRGQAFRDVLCLLKEVE